MNYWIIFGAIMSILIHATFYSPSRLNLSIFKTPTEVVEEKPITKDTGKIFELIIDPNMGTYFKNAFTVDKKYM